MKILYFAKLRQLAGRAEEHVDIPAGIGTVRELIDFLSGRDEQAAAALADLRTLKVAIDKKQATLESSLAGAGEIAFFPPVTGG
jgi:molybdopterin synthase sulfur carrier subunit